MPKYRLPSEFGPGLRCPLDREQRAKLKWQLANAHKAGRLTRAARDVGYALLRFLSSEGQCDPSYATIAQWAACKESTVGRSLIQLRECGFVRWVRRLVRNGNTVQQTSNSYALAPLEQADTQNERATEHISFKKGLAVNRAVSSDRAMDRIAFETGAQQLEALGRYADAANLRARAPG